MVLSSGIHSTESTDVLPGCNDYGRHSSVTSMLTRLGWATLEQRRDNQRLTMMYKVVHGLVAVPTTHLTAAD